jgi:hypothetical protein
LGFKRLASKDVFSLSIHADYRCRHSGRCCSVDWDVPLELPVYRSLTAAMTAGRLKTAPAAAGLEPFMAGPDLPADTAAIFNRTAEGICTFFEPSSRLCIVHRDLGETALAATCRLFPRVAVRARRGTFMGLSHFCPTAASLLFRSDVPLAIVSAPPAFPPGGFDPALYPLAEQRPSRERGQHVEVRQELHAVVGLQVLHAERQVAGELPQQRKLFGAHRQGIARRQRQHAHRRAIHRQRQHEQGAVLLALRFTGQSAREQ